MSTPPEGVFAVAVIAADHYLFGTYTDDGSGLSEYDHGTWQGLGSWPWQGVAVAVAPDGRRLLLGRDGQVGTWLEGTLSEDNLEPGRALGPLRGMRTLNNQVLAYGMNREVFTLVPSSTLVRCRSREGMASEVLTRPAHWCRMDAGLDPLEGLSFLERRKHRGASGGVDAITIDGAGRHVVVGLKGEIWTFDGQRWQPDTSPTTSWLHDIITTPTGLYACGQAGTLLHNAGTGWEALPHTGGNLDFRAIAEHNNQLYLADGHTVRTLTNEELHLADFGTGQPVPAHTFGTGPHTLVTLAGGEVWHTTNTHPWKCLIG